jgi:multiple sugar transport system substrate-binding protein
MPSAVVNWNDQDNNNAFHAKQVINCFNGSMSIELAHIDQKEEYNDQMTIGLPNSNDGKPLPAQIGEFGAVIPKGAKNLELAKEFLKYAIEPEVLNTYLKGGLGRWAIPYPSVVKSDPFWLKSGDPHRLAYITETVVGPTFPLYEAYSPAAAQVGAGGPPLFKDLRRSSRCASVSERCSLCDGASSNSHADMRCTLGQRAMEALMAATLHRNAG